MHLKHADFFHIDPDTLNIIQQSDKVLSSPLIIVEGKKWLMYIYHWHTPMSGPLFFIKFCCHPFFSSLSKEVFKCPHDHLSLLFDERHATQESRLWISQCEWRTVNHDGLSQHLGKLVKTPVNLQPNPLCLSPILAIFHKS